MLPRTFAAMLIGGAETRRPRRRFVDAIHFETAPDAVHPSQGAFVVEDPTEVTPAARVEVTPVSPAAQALADELREMTEDGAAAARHVP